ncbi:Methionine aminopeptidase [bioreactor metagenome]|jgi:methionyl aminopeptidase|uniref:Methionine aminopeptidase n=1 Tax=bioreactor metagenome TaxID=1076179 RepID=A0A644WYD2_9ZZZZ
MLNKIGRNDLCWCGSQKKYKFCHEDFDKKIINFKMQGHIVPSRKIIKTKEQIDGIRESGKVNIAILDYISNKICVGMSTEEIDKLVHSKTIELRGIPATLGYEGYPKSSCTSINSQVCHGIPSELDKLKDGDIINVDISTIYKGYYSDSSRMFCIGEVSEEKKNLVKIAKECIEKGLEQVKPWRFLGDMGYAVHQYALKNGYSVVEEIGGHGVGLELHEDPWISYISKPKTEMLMIPGMIFTIEPMLNMGTSEVFLDQENEWTIYTADSMPSAQWEVTVLVTDDGYEILAY